MKKLNQSGMGHLAIVLVIVVVGLIGFAGWYVWNQNDDKTAINSFEECVAAGNPVMESYPEQCAADGRTFTNTKQSSLLSGFKLYEDDNLSVQYPENWTQKAEVSEKDGVETETGWLHFESPDIQRTSDDVAAAVSAGYFMEVLVDHPEVGASYEADLETAEAAQKAHGGWYETIQIDGYNAVLSSTTTHGSYIHATAYAHGHSYYFRLHAADSDDEEAKDLFLQILNTVDLKDHGSSH